MSESIDDRPLDDAAAAKKAKRKKEGGYFLRSQIASLTSSTLGEVSFFVFRFWNFISIRYAAYASTLLAGIVYFFMGKYFAFKPTKSKTRSQLIKYVVVWLGNLYLNGQGPYWAAEAFHLTSPVSQSVAKFAVGLAVGFFYNYPLYRFFVFNDKEK